MQNERDIGVTIDHQLKFESHMYEKNKVKNMMGVIRLCIHLDEDMFLKLQGFSSLTYAIWKLNMISQQHKRSVSHIECSMAFYKMPIITQKIFLRRKTP